MVENSNEKGSSAHAALAALGLTYEEVAEGLRQKAEEANRLNDRRICVCGHSMNRHETNSQGLVFCTPVKTSCPCKKIKPVLITSNIRPFIRTTTGHRGFHALATALLKCVELDANIEWLELGKSCFRCGEESVNGLSPVCMTQNGYKTHDGLSVGYDALLCDHCYREV